MQVIKQHLKASIGFGLFHRLLELLVAIEVPLGDDFGAVHEVLDRVAK